MDECEENTTWDVIHSRILNYSPSQLFRTTASLEWVEEVIMSGRKERRTTWQWQRNEDRLMTGQRQGCSFARPGTATTGVMTLTAMKSKLSELRRAWRENRRAYEDFLGQKMETHLGITINFQPSRRCVESRDFREVVSLCSRSSSWSLNKTPWKGPHWICFIKWVVKLEILLRREQQPVGTPRSDP